MSILKKVIIIILSIFFCTLLCSSLAGCSGAEPLVLQVTSPEDGAEFSVNVQKVSGIVSDPEAAVQINGTEAKVAQDGAFYAYIELSEGENTIKAKVMRGKDTYSETIAVTFVPELAIYIDLETEGGVDHRITPVTVTGWVSDTKAIVTVDGKQVQVAEDGSFSTQVQLKEGSKGVEAVATLDGKEDSMSYLIGLSPEGKILRVPGWSIFYMSKGHYENDVQLKAGETKSLDFTLYTKNDIRWPSQFSYEIYKVGGEYEEDKLPMPDGLEMFMEPSSFMAYHNTVYRFSIMVETVPELAPGEYFICFEQHLEGAFDSRGWIRVTIAG